MNKKCHWSLANHLIDEMGAGSWRLHGFALKLGSVMPDILLHTYVLGHKYSTRAKRVERHLSKLKSKGSWTLWSCFRLGYNLHFLEDFFTYPHNTHFEKGLIAHCLYEHQMSDALHSYFEGARRSVPVLPAPSATIGATIRKRHNAYMETTPSIENDAAYIVSTAEIIAQEIFEAFTRQSVSRRSLAFMARALRA